MSSFLQQLFAVPPFTAAADAAAPAPSSPPTSSLPLSERWLLLSEGGDASLSRAALRREYSSLHRSMASPAAIPPELVLVFDAIERDVARTFGGSGRFGGQAERDKLRRLLSCYALRDAQVGYVQSMNFLAGFLLLHVPAEADAWCLFVRLLSCPRYAMRGYFLPNLPEVEVTSYALKALLKELAPALAAHLDAVGAEPLFYFEWYFTLFTLMLPDALLLDVWTFILADGWIAVFKLVIALLEHLEPHLIGERERSRRREEGGGKRVGCHARQSKCQPAIPRRQGLQRDHPRTEGLSDAPHAQ